METDNIILDTLIANTEISDLRRESKYPGFIANFIEKRYRKRLLKKGVVRTPEYGHLAFSLPRFREFVLRNCSAEC